MLKFLDGKLDERIGMEFKVWDWSIPELYGIVLGMMVKLNLAGTLNISKSEMLDFIIDVEKGYCDTSYHSFYHAVDVVEVLFYMLTNLDASKYLTALDSICLLIAGLCHDIGHVINARTELAKKYDDQSVLENYSCTLTLDLITKHKLFRYIHIDDEYLGCDPKEIENSLRNLIVKIILATDMTPSSIIISLDLEQRELLLKVLIHAADLSNTVRPWDTSKRWSDLIVEEFFNQGDLEKSNNLPVSPNMDREQSHQCQISLGFGDFVVKPYFEAFASFLHQASIFLDILADNRRKQLRQLEFKQEGLLQDGLLHEQQGQQRRVSLAAGLLIIPDDIQEKLRSMSSQRSPRYRRLKRSLSGRSYSHHSLLPTRNGGRVRRSSSLDHNMIRQITALYGNGDSSPTEQRIIVAGS
ncbi:4169_t:CDS:2 [Diversispora eburnea]|uniref:4169_t:CDS:1 n=1 Tax=Diversispora eburnea TaxID=1213867 RepID=A0A9N8YMB3_9GLOM|nr:4169_t:CDS:2 [Diversispora eburnea]